MTKDNFIKARKLLSKIDTNLEKIKKLKNMIDSDQETVLISVVEDSSKTYLVQVDAKTLGNNICKQLIKDLLLENNDYNYEFENL